MNEVSIVIAKPADYQEIAEIYNESIRLGEATMEETIYNAEKIEAWTKKFNDRENLYALKEGTVTIGWGIIKRYSDREGYRFTCETAIYLRSSKVRMGYGSMMKKFLIATCKEMKYKHLVAKIWASNEGSVQYNLSLGYTIVGRQEKVGYKNDKWIDVVIMQYLIE